MSFLARTVAAVLVVSAIVPITAAVASQTSGQPLTTIRFDRPNVNYEGALYSAVRGELDRNPSAAFSVVAVTPASPMAGGQALAETSVRRNAEAVVRSMTNMGLSANRINVSQTTSADATAGRVQVYVR